MRNWEESLTKRNTQRNTAETGKVRKLISEKKTQFNILKYIINTSYSEDASPVGKLWTGWSNWYGCHSMDADKWDDFPNNIAVEDRTRIVDHEGFAKVRSSLL